MHGRTIHTRRRRKSQTQAAILTNIGTFLHWGGLVLLILGRDSRDMSPDRRRHHAPPDTYTKQVVQFLIDSHHTAPHPTTALHSPSPHQFTKSEHKKPNQPNSTQTEDHHIRRRQRQPRQLGESSSKEPRRAARDRKALEATNANARGKPVRD